MKCFALMRRAAVGTLPALAAIIETAGSVDMIGCIWKRLAVDGGADNCCAVMFGQKQQQPLPMT
jgi:hypothetical protein